MLISHYIFFAIITAGVRRRGKRTVYAHVFSLKIVRLRYTIPARYFFPQPHPRNTITDDRAEILTRRKHAFFFASRYFCLSNVGLGKSGNQDEQNVLGYRLFRE